MEENLYQCKECGLHYKDKELAERCEVWCAEHKTCNVEITKQAEESKLGGLERKCEEYLNNWKRATADFINYKKEEMERMGMLGAWAKESMVLKVLPIFDSFYLAEKHAHILENVSMAEWQKGFEQIKTQISEFLKKEGIEEIKVIGQKFDANSMEIMAASSDEASLAPEGREEVVVEELQKGYKIQERVLRPAKVKVSK